MSTYWISRNGGDPEGPFILSQLRTMWGNGHITAADQVCADGAEWLPATEILGSEVLTTAVVMPPERALVRKPDRWGLGAWTPEEPEKERTRWFSLLLALLALGAIGVLGYAYFHDQGSALGLKHVFTMKEQVQKYVSTSFADRNAEVMDVGGAMGWEGGSLYLVNVRYKTPLGGPAVKAYVVQLSAETHEVLAMNSAQEWDDTYGHTRTATDYSTTANAIYRAAR